jgi:hypothetical protein
VQNPASGNAANKDAARESGGIPVLVGLAKGGTDQQKTNAAGALNSLVRDNPANRDAVRESGGIAVLVGLAKAGTGRQKAIAAEALLAAGADLETTFAANGQAEAVLAASKNEVVDDLAVDRQAEADVAAKKKADEAALKKPVREWSVDDVGMFFVTLGLEVYTDAVKKERVDGRVLHDLVTDDGLGELGVKSKIHASRIKHWLEGAAKDHAHSTDSQAVVRFRLLCLTLVPSHTYCRTFKPPCRADTHVWRVQVQARVQPHVVSTAA